MAPAMCCDCYLRRCWKTRMQAIYWGEIHLLEYACCDLTASQIALIPLGFRFYRFDCFLGKRCGQEPVCWRPSGTERLGFVFSVCIHFWLKTSLRAMHTVSAPVDIGKMCSFILCVDANIWRWSCPAQLPKYIPAVTRVVQV